MLDKLDPVPMANCCWSSCIRSTIAWPYRELPPIAGAGKVRYLASFRSGRASRSVQVLRLVSPRKVIEGSLAIASERRTMHEAKGSWF
jgi:hypothetical protein